MDTAKKQLLKSNKQHKYLKALLILEQLTWLLILLQVKDMVYLDTPPSSYLEPIKTNQLTIPPMIEHSKGLLGSALTKWRLKFKQGRHQSNRIHRIFDQYSIYSSILIIAVCIQAFLPCPYLPFLFSLWTLISSLVSYLLLHLHLPDLLNHPHRYPHHVRFLNSTLNWMEGSHLR